MVVFFSMILIFQNFSRCIFFIRFFLFRFGRIFLAFVNPVRPFPPNRAESSIGDARKIRNPFCPVLAVLASLVLRYCNRLQKNLDMREFQTLARTSKNRAKNIYTRNAKVYLSSILPPFIASPLIAPWRPFLAYLSRVAPRDLLFFSLLFFCLRNASNRFCAPKFSSF